MKNKFPLYVLVALSLALLPFNILAYSNYIIPGGENVGISISSDGVFVVGTYEVDGKLLNNLKAGDIITSINGKKVSTTLDFSKEVIGKTEVSITIIRNNKELNENLVISYVNGEYRSGLYVKDSINGIGTLTFIDPESKLFGALGHEILDSNNNVLNSNNGSIYNSYVTDINKSSRGDPGEKEADIDKESTIGNIKENTISGIFGKYTDDELLSKKALKVAEKDELKLGEAKIRTVINGTKIEEFTINITKLELSDNKKTKNILFEITDERLLSETGGIVQGMSGSPIIQDDKIIGAVTHVLVNNTKKGYGIYIVNMLNEAEN